MGREIGRLSVDGKDGQPREAEEFGELAKMHRNLVFSVALGIVRNRQIAEDVTQEALYRAFKAWPQFRGECEPHTWLARVATNVAINQYSRNREFPDLIPDQAAESDLSGEVEQTAISNALQDAIDRLPPSLRRPLVMFEFEGIGCPQIAQRLGVTAGAVRARLLRARRQLACDMASWA